MKKGQDPLRNFKQEADDFLFEDFHFDNKLKERVRQSTYCAPKRFSVSEWVRQKKLGLSLASAAIIMLLFLTYNFSTFFNEEIAQPIVDVPQTFIVVDNATLQRDGQIQLDNTEQNFTTRTNQFELPTELTNTNEAKLWFGEELLVAHYVPENFVLDTIFGFAVENLHQQIQFNYLSGTDSFSIKQNKVDAALEFFGDHVNINGVDGVITSRRLDKGTEWTELNWMIDGNLLSISGIISKEEVLKVARSLK